MTVARGPITGKQTKASVGFIVTPLSLLVAGTLILAAMFLPVVQSSDATATGYTISAHERELADLNGKIDGLQAQIAQLGATGRIKADAARIGMVPASSAPVTVAVNYPAPSTVVLPRRFVPAAVQAPLPPQHTLLWNLLHPLSPR